MRDPLRRDALNGDLLLAVFGADVPAVLPRLEVLTMVLVAPQVVLHAMGLVRGETTLLRRTNVLHCSPSRETGLTA